MTSILVVDPDHVQRNAARSHLERAGYEVLTAKSPKEAMLLARHHRPDLIVSQEFDGLDLCKRIREEASLSTPVVLVSERVSESDRDRAFKLGALELIERSTDFKRELTWIRVAVQQVRGAS
jgi:DNA-binding response OmpR family regulator